MKFATRSEMQRLDEQAIQEYGIPSLILMENAGRASAEELMRLVSKSQISVFSGKGNNGGDGFVVARHLHNHGYKPVVFCFQKPAEMKPDPLVNFHIITRMGVQVIDCSRDPNLDQIKQTLKSSKMTVDALFGIGLSKPIDEPFRSVINIMNEFHSKTPILAIDVPSGLDADSGQVLGVCVRAKLTVTLALPKKAFFAKTTRRYTGKVIVADISIPRDLLTKNKEVK